MVKRDAGMVRRDLGGSRRQDSGFCWVHELSRGHATPEVQTEDHSPGSQAPAEACMGKGACSALRA